MQIICCAVIKGGAGKTTTTAALAQAAANAGKRVLAIDLDPQANLTLFLNADPNQRGSFELLTEGAAYIQKTDQGLDVISASADLATITTSTGSAKRLKKALDGLKKYSYIFIDTPPQMGELTYNALMASTGLLIPLEADSGSLQGLYQIADIATQLQASNPNLQIYGTVITRYDGRPKINRYMKQQIEDQGAEAGAPLLASIRQGAPIKEAQGFRQSLFDYAPRSKPAEDYKQLFELLEKKRR